MSGREDATLSSRTAVSAAWLVTARLLTKLIDFCSLLILARLLSPVEFGVVAVAMTLVVVVETVLDMPIHLVLVRQAKIEPVHLDTAFTLGLLRGVVLAAVLLVLAVPFSHFYSDSRLPGLIAILSLAPALRGLLSPRIALFAQKLDYRRDFAIELLAKLFSFAVATTAALTFRDYRAIIVGTLTTPATMAFISYVLAPYRPRLSLAAWPIFADFVSIATASQFLAAINWQCDRLILGAFVSRARMGEFALANDLAYLPEQALIKPIMRPVVSAFSLIQTDMERLDSAYAKTATTLLAVGTPIMLGLSLLARPAVEFALGGKWLAAIPILTWLSLTLIPALFTAPLGSLALALGRPGMAMRQIAIESVIKLPLVAIGAIYFGVEGVVVARGATSLAMGIVATYHVKLLIGTPIRRQIASAWRVAASSAVLIAVLLLIRPVLDGRTGIELGVLLGAVGAIGLAAYLATMMTLWNISGRPSGLESAAYHRLHLLLARR